MCSRVIIEKTVELFLKSMSIIKHQTDGDTADPQSPSDVWEEALIVSPRLDVSPRYMRSLECF